MLRRRRTIFSRLDRQDEFYQKKITNQKRSQWTGILTFDIDPIYLALLHRVKDVNDGHQVEDDGGAAAHLPQEVPISDVAFIGAQLCAASAVWRKADKKKIFG